MLQSYTNLVETVVGSNKRRFAKNIIKDNYLFQHFAIKKLIGICTDSGLKIKTTHIFNKSIILLKKKTKKDINMLIERSFSFLNMLISPKVIFSGNKRLISESIITTYQANRKSISSFAKYMQISKHKTLSLKIYNSFLELYNEKGYLLLEKNKKYVSILKSTMR
jgi:hypothetical protein